MIRRWSETSSKTHNQSHMDLESLSLETLIFLVFHLTGLQFGDVCWILLPHISNEHFLFLLN